jgi:hypothetical protein
VPTSDGEEEEIAPERDSTEADGDSKSKDKEREEEEAEKSSAASSGKRKRSEGRGRGRGGGGSKRGGGAGSKRRRTESSGSEYATKKAIAVAEKGWYAYCEDEAVERTVNKWLSIVSLFVGRRSGRNRRIQTLV